MRKKMLLLALSLAALAGSLISFPGRRGRDSRLPDCTTYSDGSHAASAASAMRTTTFSPVPPLLSA